METGNYSEQILYPFRSSIYKAVCNLLLRKFGQGTFREKSSAQIITEKLNEQGISFASIASEGFRQLITKQLPYLVYLPHSSSFISLPMIASLHQLGEIRNYFNIAHAAYGGDTAIMRENLIPVLPRYGKFNNGRPAKISHWLLQTALSEERRIQFNMTSIHRAVSEIEAGGIVGISPQGGGEVFGKGLARIILQVNPEIPAYVVPCIFKGFSGSEIYPRLALPTKLLSGQHEISVSYGEPMPISGLQKIFPDVNALTGYLEIQQMAFNSQVSEDF